MFTMKFVFFLSLLVCGGAATISKGNRKRKLDTIMEELSEIKKQLGELDQLKNGQEQQLGELDDIKMDRSNSLKN